jgi:hypothetical protein
VIVAPVKIVVEAVASHQLVVRAALHDAAVVDDDDLVGAPDRGDAVRDHDRSATAEHAFQLIENAPLGGGVHAGQRVVEDDDLGVLGDRARECEPLLLAARQRDPALADLRLVSWGTR